LTYRPSRNERAEILPDETVAEFYDRMQVDGRAVLEGTPSQPYRWIARIGRRDGAAMYVLCFDDVVACRIVQADDPVQRMHLVIATEHRRIA
jgi:hypothetical protein